jgi:hypothetical protein
MLLRSLKSGFGGETILNVALMTRQLKESNTIPKSSDRPISWNYMTLVELPPRSSLSQMDRKMEAYVCGFLPDSVRNRTSE